MKKLKLYAIDEKYINYLREFDNKVFYNKKASRPYVGVVLTHNNYNYFAPLSSLKPKHIKLNKNAPDIYKINEGTLGIININNMIPTPKYCLKEVLPFIKEKNYKSLLIKQLKYLNKNKNEIYGKVKTFMLQYEKGYLNNKMIERCCDFKLLEQKCLEYENELILS